MALRGKAPLRRVGNSLCLPLPMRDLKQEGLKEGDEVQYFVYKQGVIPPEAFGSRKGILKGVNLQALMDEDRADEERSDRRKWGR